MTALSTNVAASASHKIARIASLIAGLFVLLVSLGGCSENSARSAAAKPNTVPVVAVAAVSKSIPIDIHGVGNVEPYSTIAVKAQVSGELTRVSFREGDYVKKGDVLFTIDARPYEAAVNQAEANLARDTAQLSQAEANLARDTTQEKYSREQAERHSQLFHDGLISKEQYGQYDTDAQSRGDALRADTAAIESARASINGSKAALERAKLDLNYCTIRSPLDGRTGSIMVKQGNIVGAGNVNLVMINEVRPIYVSFTAPESQLAAIKQHMAAGQLTVYATPSGDAVHEKGVLTFVDNAVDASTGTIRLKATFANPDLKLWPGQFANAVLTLAVRPNALLIPSMAIQNGQEGAFVFVVDKDMKVEQRPVKTSISVETDSVIEQGLQPGEMVVTEGQLRLAPGMRVQLKNAAGSKS